MPFTVLVLGIAVTIGYLRGGRLSRIAEGVGWSWLLLVGLGLQVAVDAAASRGQLPSLVGTGLLLASQLLVAVWGVLNRYRPGMPLILLGLLLNAVVLAANGAMPVAPEAIAAIRLPGVEPIPAKHEIMTDASRLRYLADVVPLPPLRTIVSVGDIVLGAGLVPLLSHLMSYRTPSERRGGRRGPLPEQR
ncbi:MAG: DUF5317 domain-containing protein [Actinomycetota bacterium]|nr:DUF5317 domain-containing protein [Actinomycetota bacterium]